MNRNDVYGILFLWITLLVVFFPVFNSVYVYTDEAVQLWLYRRGSGYQMFGAGGRWLSEKLFQWLFGSIHTIREISYLRWFSLAGWMLSVPVWYYVLTRVVTREGLPKSLVFISMVYLITMPPMTIYIGWAAVMELFIANTSGVLSGYILYNALAHSKRGMQLIPALIGSVMIGCISLFTYQNGFGCFLLPFLLHVMARTRLSKTTLWAIAVYFFIYAFYYFLFRVQLAITHTTITERSALHFNVLNKLLFLFTRPLNSAFHFTWLFNEKSIPGLVIYAVLFGTWIVVSFFQRNSFTVGERCKYFATVFCFFGLLYLPSLVVKENYASNRTLFALNMAVFFLVAQTIYIAGRRTFANRYGIAVLSLLFILNAVYNFSREFLMPVTNEYTRLSGFVNDHYNKNTDTVYFIRPQEDFYEKKYGITRSWDEFGVPSTFFEWTPEFLVKQIVFEKTGDRSIAEKIVVRNWLGEDAYRKDAVPVGPHVLVIDAARIIK